MDTSHPQGGSPTEANKTDYDNRYAGEGFYWGLKPSSMALRVLEHAPPIRRLHLLDVGCGEGKDAIFFARNGYRVAGFDASRIGIDKARAQAERMGLEIDFSVGDINAAEMDGEFDVIFSSGTLQYLTPSRREPVMRRLQEMTAPGGIHVLHVFVAKPFVAIAPDAEPQERLWHSGELNSLYRDWKIEWSVEEIKPCNSSGIAHEHASNRIVARKMK